MIQEQVLNKILSTGDMSVLTLNNITPEYFSDYGREFAYINHHVEQYGKVPDLVTFLNVFPDFTVITVNEPDSYLLGELIKDRQQRLYVESFNKMRSNLMNGDTEACTRIIAELAEKQSKFITLEATDIMHDTSRYERYEDKVNNPDKFFITTGFKELDKIIQGWDINEELATIVARNGVGKSWILDKCAAAAARAGKVVGLYSGEMSEDAVGYRVDTLVGNVSNGALVHGGGSVRNEYKNFLERLKKECAGNLWVLTPKTIGGPATVPILKAFVEKYKLDILFIDQHSLLDDARGAKTPVEKASNISKDLKLLQSTKHIPVICVSQQNREKLDEGKTFDTTQIAQSDRIGQDSSVIIFLERTNEFMKLHLIKSRQSSSGEVLTYSVDLNKGTFKYQPTEKDLQRIDEDSPATFEGYSSEDVIF